MCHPVAGVERRRRADRRSIRLPRSLFRRIVASSHRRIVASSHRRIVASSHRRIVERVAGGVGASIGAVFTVVGRTRGLREDPFSRWR